MIGFVSTLREARLRCGDANELHTRRSHGRARESTAPLEVLPRWPDFAAAEGRAVALEAVAGLLPRIAAFMAKLPEDKRDPSWLPDLILGFAADCHDSGLRDVATVLNRRSRAAGRAERDTATGTCRYSVRTTLPWNATGAL
jgi:hypothetical protein